MFKYMQAMNPELFTPDWTETEKAYLQAASKSVSASNPNRHEFQQQLQNLLKTRTTGELIRTLSLDESFCDVKSPSTLRRSIEYAQRKIGNNQKKVAVIVYLEQNVVDSLSKHLNQDQHRLEHGICTDEGDIIAEMVNSTTSETAFDAMVMESRRKKIMGMIPMPYGFLYGG